MDNRLIISVALSGGGTSKKATPYVPVTAEEIAKDVVAWDVRLRSRKTVMQDVWSC